MIDPQQPLAMLFALAIAHAVADFPLQGDYLAQTKIRGFANGSADWIVALCAHSLIHAGAVWLVTGSAVLGFAEFLLHGAIDFAKGRQAFSFVVDQVLHLLCKAGYVIVLALGWF